MHDAVMRFVSAVVVGPHIGGVCSDDALEAPFEQR